MRIIQRGILRSANGPLRPFWALAYGAAVRSVAVCLRWRVGDVSVYTAGSLGRGEPVYGLSDLDMVGVSASEPSSPGHARDRLVRRRERIARLLSGLGGFADLAVCEDHELRRSVAESVRTYGLDGKQGAAGILAGTTSSRVADLQERPGVGPPLDGWCLVAGPERRPPAPPATADRCRLAAWLELQFWWRIAFRGCLHPDAASTPYLYVKLVCAAVRTWLWIEYGESGALRREVLLSGLRALPEEEPILRRALELNANLSRPPVSELGEALGLLVRMTVRVAGQLQQAADGLAMCQVRLAGSSGDLSLPGDVPSARVVPLADWRAIVTPRLPDEGLLARAGDPSDPGALADAARAWRPGLATALQWGPIVVLPAPNAQVESVLRAAQCSISDPVTHALLAGRQVAAFPELRGFSASDVARRAVAEHADWLRRPTAFPRRYARIDEPQPVIALARLLTAARAALFAQSVARHEPILPITVAATGSLARDEQLAEAIERARVALRDWRQHAAPCPNSAADDLREAVLKLDAYRGAKPISAGLTPSSRSAVHRRGAR